MNLKRSISAGLAAIAIPLAFAAPSGATEIVANTTLDEFNQDVATCSLREAVYSARTNSAYNGCAKGTDDDTIALAAGHYELSRAGAGELAGVTGDLNVGGSDSQLTIAPLKPTDKVTIDAKGIDRVISVYSGASLTLKNLTLTGGDVAGPGGGLAALSLSGSVTLDGVSVVGNKAQQGGGISLANGKLRTIVNSTISGNSATGNGGGVYVTKDASAVIRSTTITGNKADSDADDAGDGGGIGSVETAGPVNLVNSINASNEDLSPDPAKRANDCATGSTFFPRYVLTTQALGAGSCLVGFNPETNRVVTDPKLGPLADNGGPTLTHALLTGSPALDAAGAAAPDDCPVTDQRGETRPPGACDIGSFELKTPPEPPVPDCKSDPTLPGCPLGPIPGPTVTTATFDGSNLHVRLKCPARFKPKCVSRAVPVTARGAKGKPMAKVKKVTTRSNKWVKVSFVIKPAYRAKVQAMTKVDAKRLVVRQKIRSKRIGKRKNRKSTTVFHVYKVRIQG